MARSRAARRAILTSKNTVHGEAALPPPISGPHFVTSDCQRSRQLR